MILAAKSIYPPVASALLLAWMGTAGRMSHDAVVVRQPAVVVQSQQLTWSGDVVEVATVMVHGTRVWIDKATRPWVMNATAVFHGALPKSPSTVRLASASGQGSVAIVQQPSDANNFTVTVRIVDPWPGPDHHQFTLGWSRLVTSSL
ncbi:MAG: hypothetical protein ACLQVD_03995 [Capsulimonadaceae bacterium]